VPVGSAVRVRVASGVVVPSVIGTAPTEARARLTAAGLSVESREVRTDRSGANTVIEQAPTAGQRVARGTAVLVSIALPPLVTVPDVRGRQRGEAAGLLAAAQLKNEVSNDLAAALAPGLVTRQAPGPGAQVVAGSVVRLQVAVGVVVPSVVGAGVEDARARVASSGLRANVREVRTDAARAGTVFEQLPVADERVARGSVVELSLARLPLVTVPDLAQRTRAEAESLIKAARLLAAFDDDRESTLPPDRVTRQEPAPGTPVEAGQTVRVAMSTGVLVPSVLKMTAQSARGTLAAAGLRSEERGEVSDLFPESTVMDQAPGSNARVARGSAIRLLIAVRRTVTVPDLRGRARSEISAILAPIPLVASFDVAAQAEPGAVADTVVRQSPAAGSVVGAGTAVTVFLAQAAQAPAPPAPPATSQPQPASPAQPPQSLQPEPTPLPRPATGWRARVIPWVVGLGFFGLLGYRFYAANHTRPHAVAHEAPPPPPPQVNLDPHQDEMTSRLEVSGQGLIQFEVRIQSGLDAGEQFLSVDGPLAGEDRRVYE
jgi:beta-lactam-binding protein with PASTA domain